MDFLITWDYGDWGIAAMFALMIAGMVAGTCMEEKRMSSRDRDEKSGAWKVWTFVIFYIMMTTLVAGHSWHTTCNDATGRYPCSVFLGAIWPVTLLSKFGIWVMDPATQWPSIQFSSEPKR